MANRHTVRAKGGLVLLCALVGGLASLVAPQQARADILAEVYCDGLCTDPLLIGLKNNLDAAALLHGAGSVTWVLGATPGSLATDLAANSYDQVFIWDITATPGLTSAADQTALNNWYNNSRGVVVDGRSYGQYMQPGNGTEGNYIGNVVKNFFDNNGGLWIGTDHEPTWTNNGNDLLNALGFNPISNQIFAQDVSLNATNPFVNPAALTAAGLAWNWSAGEAPVGLQPNGITLKPLAWVSGGTVPMISTALIPEPASLVLLSLCGWSVCRRSRG